MSDYPRTCRNGHLIEGPEREHLGEHRQCWACRRRTQRDADQRYDERLGILRSIQKYQSRAKFADERDARALEHVQARLATSSYHEGS